MTEPTPEPTDVRAVLAVEATGGMDTARIETLGDGIFAIVITLLVLELKVPEVPHDALPAVVLPGLLLAMGPKFVSWLLSFVMVAVYWQAHHVQYNLIRRVDRPLIWLNMLFFLAVAIIPFTAGLLGSYPSTQLPVVLYGVNLIVVNLSLAWHWHHASNRHWLVDEQLDDAAVETAYRRILLPPAVYTVAIALSFLDPRLAIVLYALMPIAYIIPTPVNRFFNAPYERQPKAPPHTP
ncbi:MAG: hypothetical protein JWM80_6090 [Cyanobacteria bacterium RYN_339]|nr:hypothetical protein [Cyanobacteria bacterium RYN_339]